MSFRFPGVGTTPAHPSPGRSPATHRPPPASPEARLTARSVRNALATADIKSPASPQPPATPVTRRSVKVVPPGEPVAAKPLRGPSAAKLLVLGIAGRSHPRTLAVAIADALGCFEGSPTPQDLKQLAAGIAERAGRLPLPCLVEIGSALGSATPSTVAGAQAVTASLVAHLLEPVHRAGHAASAAALALGLRRACEPGPRIAKAPAEALAAATKRLNEWVAGLRTPQGSDAHALMVCALALGSGQVAAGSPGPSRPVASPPPGGPGSPTRKALASGPDTLGRLLARDPLQLLLVEGPASVRRLSLVSAALRLLAADDPARLRGPYERLMATPPSMGEWPGLLLLLRQGRESAGAGAWSARQMPRETFRTLLKMTLTQTATLWLAHANRIQNEASEQVRAVEDDSARAWHREATVETKGGFRESPGYQQAVAAAQAGAEAWAVREESAVQEVVVGEVLAYLAGFGDAAWVQDRTRVPDEAQRQFVREQQDWLRALAAQNRSAPAAGENAVRRITLAMLADRVADALDVAMERAPRVPSPARAAR